MVEKISNYSEFMYVVLMEYFEFLTWGMYLIGVTASLMYEMM